MKKPHKTLVWSAPFALLFAGCGDIALEPLSERADEVDVVNPESDDPYACEVVELEPGSEPILSNRQYFGAVCKSTGLECRSDGTTGYYMASTPGGPVYGTVDLSVSCAQACASDDDCPPPESGSASPTCVITDQTDGVCMLPCSTNDVCPDGFSCREEPRPVYLDDLDQWTPGSPYPDHCIEHFQRALPDGAAPP